MDKAVATNAGPSKAQRATLAAVMACALAKPAEGLYLTTYYDPAGILTACYGTTGKDVTKGARYTLAQCEAFIDRDMRAKIQRIERCAPGLPIPVLAAFADAAYNVGEVIACDTKNSTAARYLAKYSATEYKDGATGRQLLLEACHQLPRWDKARVMGVLTPLKGLTKRRMAERDLCLQGLPA